MCRCYRGTALVLGTILMTSMVPLNSCSVGSMNVYAAEDTQDEVMEQAFQTEVQPGEENVETEIPVEEEPVPEEPAEAEPVPEEPTEADSSFYLDGQEYQVLLRIVEAEAGGEDTTGKMLVANVIMNRVRSSQFPDTVPEVVYQRHNGAAQFSPTADGRINTVNVSSDTVQAVTRVMNGEDYSAGALFFRSVHSRSGWFDRALHRVVEHGNHIFYTM